MIVRNQGVNITSDAVDTLNARIGLEMQKWQVYLEGRNLTNSNSVTFPGIFGLPDSRVAPRWLGMTARTQF
jgi:hypothetical protein